MLRPRRFALQLTPLLDMLLILLFVQYLDVRERQHSKEAQTASVVADLEETRARLKALLAEEALLRLQMETERGRRLAAESDAAASESNLQQARQHQAVLAGLMAEIFQIPPEEVNRLLAGARVPALEQSPQELARVKGEIAEFSRQHRGRMIEYLLTYDEIRKRCDVWDFHIDGNDVATLTAGDRTTRLRLPTLASENVDVPQFIAEVDRWYHSLPQPKSLVVILLTYDRQTRIATMDAIRRAMPELLSRMHADHMGQLRFEYADLGFRLE